MRLPSKSARVEDAGRYPTRLHGGSSTLSDRGSPHPQLAALLGALFLIGGPIYIGRNMLERRRARKAAAAFDHPARAEEMFWTIGPMSHDELTSLLRLTLYSISTDGSVGWQETLNNAALARRLTRDLAALENERPTDATSKPDDGAETDAPASPNDQPTSTLGSATATTAVSD